MPGWPRASALSIPDGWFHRTDKWLRRDVPWNAPFYGHRGFRIVDGAALSTAHAGLEESERQRGLRTDLRVTMAYETAG